MMYREFRTFIDHNIVDLSEFIGTDMKIERYEKMRDINLSVYKHNVTGNVIIDIDYVYEHYRPYERQYSRVVSNGSPIIFCSDGDVNSFLDLIDKTFGTSIEMYSVFYELLIDILKEYNATEISAFSVYGGIKYISSREMTYDAYPDVINNGIITITDDRNQVHNIGFHSGYATNSTRNMHDTWHEKALELYTDLTMNSYCIIRDLIEYDTRYMQVYTSYHDNILILSKIHEVKKFLRKKTIYETIAVIDIDKHRVKIYGCQQDLVDKLVSYLGRIPDIEITTIFYDKPIQTIDTRPNLQIDYLLGTITQIIEKDRILTTV